MVYNYLVILVIHLFSLLLLAANEHICCALLSDVLHRLGHHHQQQSVSVLPLLSPLLLPRPHRLPRPSHPLLDALYEVPRPRLLRRLCDVRRRRRRALRSLRTRGGSCPAQVGTVGE